MISIIKIPDKEKPRNRGILKKLGIGLTAILLTGGTIKLGDNILKDAEFERTRREVQTSDEYFGLDKNENGVVDTEEWSPVYEFLGMENTGRYGLDLTTDQLREYTKNQEGETQ